MRPEATIEIDWEKAGLSFATRLDVARALTAFNEIELPISGTHGHVTIEGPKLKLITLKDLEVLPLPSVNPLVNLMIRDVAKVSVTSAPSGRIPHEDGQPCVIVFANLEGRTLEQARTDLRRITEDLADTGVKIEVE